MNGYVFHLWYIPLLPFAGFLINGILCRRLPKWLVTIVALLAPLAAFGVVLSAYASIYIRVASQYATCGPYHSPYISLPYVETSVQQKSG